MRIGELVFNQETSFPTMQIDAGTQVGDAVTMTGPARVGRGVDGNFLYGKVLKIEGDGLGTVAIWGAGFTDVPTIGTLATGQQVLIVDGTGKAKVAAANTPGRYTIVNIAQAGTANIQL